MPYPYVPVYYYAMRASQVALVVKNLPAKAVDLRCWSDPLVGKILCRKNGKPLKDSCLYNPMDRGAQWAHEIPKSRTRLKQLCSFMPLIFTHALKIFRYYFIGHMQL